MSNHSITPRDTESPFQIDELFFSTTDRKGIITFGNDVFARVSGYAFADLMAKPHNIIRHPDMPAVVFKVLWDTLLAGRSIVAYVKNMARDGSYYWVCAFVAPINGGFLSIRLKPSSAIFAQVRELYKQLREKEREIESRGTRKEAMTASGQMLENAVRSLGFADYERLMHVILPTETAARRQAVQGKAGNVESDTDITGALRTLTESCHALERTVGGMLKSVDSYLALEKTLSAEARFVRELGTKLALLSLNAQIRTAAIGQDGRALQVVAEQMSRSSRGVSESSHKIVGFINEATQTLKTAAFHITTGDLSLEMMSAFLRELAARKADQQDAAMRQNVARLAEVVDASLKQAGTLAAESSTCIGNLQQRLEDFVRELQTLEILHVTGRVEAIRCRHEGSINGVLDEMRTLTRESRKKLSALAEEASAAAIKPPDELAVKQHLTALSAG